MRDAERHQALKNHSIIDPKPWIRKVKTFLTLAKKRITYIAIHGTLIFLGIILFCLSRYKSEIFSISFIYNFLQPHKI